MLGIKIWGRLASPCVSRAGANSIDICLLWFRGFGDLTMMGNTLFVSRVTIIRICVCTATTRDPLRYPGQSLAHQSNLECNMSSTIAYDHPRTIRSTLYIVASPVRVSSSPEKASFPRKVDPEGRYRPSLNEKVSPYQI